MLFTEQDLYVNNGLNILNEATYLSEEESLINPITIPVKKVDRLGYGVVRFDDVEKLAEDYGVDYIDAMYAIAESSDMNPGYLAVSVPEEDIIAYPEIVNELANIVIQPLSEYDDEYQYVAECVNVWLESGNDEYLGLLLEMPQDQWDYVASQKGLTKAQKEAIGARFMGKTRVPAKTLYKVVQSYSKQASSARRSVHQAQRGVKKIKGDKGNSESLTTSLASQELLQRLANNRLSNKYSGGRTMAKLKLARLAQAKTPSQLERTNERLSQSRQNADIFETRWKYGDKKIDELVADNIKAKADTKSLVAGLNQAAKEGNMSRQEAEKLRQELQASNDRTGRVLQQRDSYMNAFQKADSDLTAERTAHDKTKEQLDQAQKSSEERQQTIDTLNQNIKKSSEEHEAYKNKGLHRAADKLYSAGNWVKNNKGKTALGVGLGAAAIGGGIYAYKQYKNKPRSVIAKRIAALRSIYKKFMVNAQRNPQKANIFKRMAAKILSVIDKLMAFMQNATN